MASKFILFIIIFFTIFSYCISPAISQKRNIVVRNQHNDFYQLLNGASLKFTFPQGFKEIKTANNDFDFALHDAAHNCEVWVMVRSQKQNWISYERTQNDKNRHLANPDSMYLDIAKSYATSLTGGNNFYIRNMPAEVLAEYNADAGKSYLLNLLDMSMTHHYNYALVVSLQKNHTGTLVAIFFTNYKDPDFYRDVNLVSHSFTFAP